MSPLIAPIIGAAGSLFGSIAGGIFGSKNQSDANSANMKLAEYKYDRDLDMWNRQNAYNSPEAQMRRYAQAGLNPNLIYGQGSSGNASSAPDFDAPNIGAYTNFGDFGASNAAGNYVAAFNADRQSELAASQIEYQKAMMAQAYATTTGIELENLKKNVENARAYFDYGLQTKYGEEQIKASLANSWQNVKTSQASQQNLLSQVGVNDARADLLYRQAATELERTKLTKAQTFQVYRNINLIGRNISHIDEQIKQLKKQGNLTDAQAASQWLIGHGLISKNESERTKADWLTIQIVTDIIAKGASMLTGGANAASQFIK